MRFSDIREEEEHKYKERLRLKRLEEENKKLKELLAEHGILIMEKQDENAYGETR